MVQWLMTRFVGQNHRSNAFHCVSKLATLNALKNKKFIVNPRVNLCINAKFTQLSEKEEKKTDIKDESFVKKNKPPKHGSLVTILSLDGGGVRGIIGGVILAKLEEHLQEIDGNDARIANYFDVIAGTSTGGLMTAMLTAPHPDKKDFPLYAAKEIVPFYKVESSKIFESKWWTWWTPVLLINLMGPRYDGEYLHKRLGEILKETRLSETLTNVVLPTFDIKELQPTIFSSFEADVVDPSLDVKLSDICIGTSAAPYFLPPYEFSNEDKKGERRTFNLLDGGVTANDPTLVGMTAMSRRSINKHPDMDGFMPLDYDKYLVISIGTGSASRQEFYSAKMAAKWGFFGWGFNWTSKQIPIIDTFSESSRDMVQYHTSVLFQALKSEDNYLRIDFDKLEKEEASMDNAKDSNLIKLEEDGNNLLKAKVTRMNLNTFKYELIPDREVTNCQELKRFAKLLSDERKLRMKTSETMDEDSSN